MPEKKKIEGQEPAQKASPAKNVRGLRQYQKQQGHISGEAKTQRDKTEHALDNYLNKNIRGESLELSKESARQSTRQEEKAKEGLGLGAAEKKQIKLKENPKPEENLKPEEKTKIEEKIQAQIKTKETAKAAEIVTKTKAPSENVEKALSPYQIFVAELSPQDMEYLLRESNVAIQVLLLKNSSREERSKILQEMPREQRSKMLRALAESLQKLDGDACSKAFHWLLRKVHQKHYPATKIAESELDDAGGIKALSMILDGLEPEQEEFIVASFQQDDEDLASWLERDRGSAEQREILRELCEQLKPLELAALFAEPKYGRLLRHLLSAEQMLEVLNASIDFARLSGEKRSDIAEELYSNFPVLQKY